MRLIDADILLKTIEESPPLNWTDSAEEIQACNGYSLFIEEIKSAPTIDPVKHGHWVEFGERSEYEGCIEYHCSECNFAVLGNDGVQWNYCSNCGAKMDEVNE